MTVRWTVATGSMDRKFGQIRCFIYHNPLDDIKQQRGRKTRGATHLLSVLTYACRAASNQLPRSCMKPLFLRVSSILFELHLFDSSLALVRFSLEMGLIQLCPLFLGTVFVA